MKQILEFIKITDKLKSISRKTSPIGLDRKENSAEHSWQVMLAAICFQKFSNFEVDINRVIKMLLIHDLPEVRLGDTFHYDKTADLFEKEIEVLKEYLSLLPQELSEELFELFLEFEERKTYESKYANAIDRLIAFIMNSNNDGGSWKEFNLSYEKVVDNNVWIKEGSDQLYLLALELLDSYEAYKKK